MMRRRFKQLSNLGRCWNVAARSALAIAFAWISIHSSSAVWAVDFDHEIVPLLREHCSECHGGEEAKGGFSINSRRLFLESDAATPGSSLDSYVMDLVRSDDPDARMPPKDRPAVPQAGQELLARWIDAGMPWTAGFSFAESNYVPPLLPRKVELPGPASANPIDQLISRYLREHDLPVPEPVDDHLFVRRASMDLVGLLPEPSQIEAFVNEASADKRQRLIDDLLSREMDYAEHWLTFWNDLLRNDYSGTGFITGGRKQISQWLYRALIDNKPFDQFTRELVAPPTEASSGFIDGIKWRGTVSAGQTNEIQFAQSVAQSLLGINLKCASCHDSFIDRWTLNEAYSLAAVYATEPLDIHRCDQPTGETATAGWLFPELGSIDADADREERLQQLAKLITHRDNGRYARTIVNRLWGQMMGRGLVHPLDAMHTRPWNEDLLDFLAEYLVEHDYDLKAVLRLIATSNAYASVTVPVDTEATQDDDVYRGPRAKRMTAEQFVDAIWQLTGAAPSQFDAPVTRGKADPELAEAIPLHGEWIWGKPAEEGQPAPAGQTLVFRKQLSFSSPVVGGSAVITADNSWELYLGRRKVGSGDDWTRPQTIAIAPHLDEGENEIVIVAHNGGDHPNPAGLLVEASVTLQDGSVHRIATDTSWQYSSRAPRGRREGRLGSTPGPWQSAHSLGKPNVYAQVDEAMRLGLALASEVRSSMVRASLMKADFLMRSLGRPNRDQIVTSRPSELTTLEAIDLSNGQQLADYLAMGAAQWSKQDLNTDQFVRKLYMRALCRPPTAPELEAIRTAVGPELDRKEIEDVMWAVCMTPEFLVIR